MKQQLLTNNSKLLSQSMSEISGKFTVYFRNQEVTLTLNDDSIHIGTSKIDLNDAIGLKKNLGEEKKGVHFYTIYSYPIKNKQSKKPKRHICELKFGVKDVQSWQSLRTKIIMKISNRKEGQSFKLLICFNPNAGSNSHSHLVKIRAFLEYTNLQYEVFTTEYRNHCLQHLKKIDTKIYCGVAIVSGDGLMHQYVNSFCGLPVTHVPAGSGNAFSKTQTQIAGEQCKDQETMYLVVKNRTKQFNIVRYDFEKLQTPIYSFLALEWAIIADLDMNSQFLRCLGGFRFEVYAAWRCIFMKRYRGRLTYAISGKQLPPLSTPIPENTSDYTTVTDTFLHTIFNSIPYISDKYRIAPSVKVEQRLMDVQFLTQNDGRWQLIKYLLNSDSGSHFSLQEEKPANGFRYTHSKVKGFRLEPLNPDQMGIFGIDGEAYEAQKIQASFDERTFSAFV